MDIVYILLPMAFFLALGFLGAFIWAVRQGQFDDLETPKFRILLDNDQKGSDR